MGDTAHPGVPKTIPSDLRLRGQEAVSNVWQEIAVSPSFAFDGLSLLDSSGAEIAHSAGSAWLLDDGRRMLALAFEADRNIAVRAVGRGGKDDLVLSADGADSSVRVNGRSLVVNGRTVLGLDGLGRWNHPSNSRVRFRLVTVG